MLELTPQQTAVLERLPGAGFALVAFPLYERHVGVRKGNCAALLSPGAAGALEIFGEPCYLVEGHLSVQVRHDGREWFVWKQQQIEATPERLVELERFKEELAAALRLPA